MLKILPSINEYFIPNHNTKSPRNKSIKCHIQNAEWYEIQGKADNERLNYLIKHKQLLRIITKQAVECKCILPKGITYLPLSDLEILQYKITDFLLAIPTATTKRKISI